MGFFNKKKIFFIIITIFTIFFLPNVNRAEKFKIKGWWYFEGLDFGWSAPLSLVEIRGGKVAFGFSPPISFGVGVEMVEAVMESERWIAKDMGALYFYWLPFINWTKKENNIFASQVFYLFFRFNKWSFSEKYTKIGMGVYYSLWHPFLSFYGETGLDKEKITTLFVNIGISFIAGFNPIGFKEF
ncbi:MAG: hypothetical protein RMJ34_00355 [candidate division WOR-3 bacterium]|nr:hypothetical protein [candidate division WOR-3 bacterium]MDW8113373.1 hypothetical protein [candidate division WOR-3 bacterium]